METTTQESVADMFGGSTESLEKDTEQMAVFIATEDAELEILDAQLKERKAKLDEAKTKLAEIMLQNGQESIKFANGLSPKAKIQVKFFKAAGIEDTQLFDWLRDNNMGDIIKPYVHFQTLQSTVKSFIDQGGNVPAELLTETKTPTITMYGKSKFLAAKALNAATQPA